MGGLWGLGLTMNVVVLGPGEEDQFRFDQKKRRIPNSPALKKN